MPWQVDTRDELTVAALVDLMEERSAALHIPAYCDEQTARRLADVLQRHPSRTNYEVRWGHRDAASDRRHFEPTDVDRVGPTDTTPHGLPASAAALSMIRLLRTAAKELGPIDRLRLELDEICPRGAGVLHVDGELRLAGVGRVMERSEGVVHADTGRRSCLTANVYLQMPSIGGTTRIWKHDGPYRSSIDSYRFGIHEIPRDAPVCTVTPGVGDLVIWNPALPHVVDEFTGATRITLQTWLQVTGHESPNGLGVTLLN